MKKDSKDPERPSRRKFAKTVAAALVAAPLASVLADAQTPVPTQTPAAPKEPVAPPNPQPTPSAQAAAQQQPSPLAEAYAEVTRVRFGGHLDEEDSRRLRRDLEGYARTSQRLGAFKLQNSDEPDFVFIA